MQGINPLPNGYKTYNPKDLINAVDTTPYKVIVKNIGNLIEEACRKDGR